MAKFIKLTAHHNEKIFYLNADKIVSLGLTEIYTEVRLSRGELRVNESIEQILMLIAFSDKATRDFPTDDRLYEGAERDYDKVVQLSKIDAKPKTKSDWAKSIECGKEL